MLDRSNRSMSLEQLRGKKNVETVTRSLYFEEKQNRKKQRRELTVAEDDVISSLR